MSTASLKQNAFVCQYQLSCISSISDIFTVEFSLDFGPIFCYTLRAITLYVRQCLLDRVIS